MADATLDDLVSIMTGDQSPRVWSLLVSLFGDLAQRDGDAITTQTLNQIMGSIRIRPEATRVALHRLRKEGWLQSQRNGRSSLYSLTELGRAETLAASPRIYEMKPPPPEAWIAIGQNRVSSKDALAVAPNVTVTTAIPRDANILALRITETDPLPIWVQDELCSPDFVTQTAQLIDKLQRLRDALPGRRLQIHETVVLRVLIVHAWRRIALKMPDLPQHLLPQSWHGPKAQALALSLLRDIPAPEPSALTQAERY